MIPKNITKDHLLSAINDIRKNPDLLKGRASTTYDAVYNNELYPPKLIVSLSNKYANGKLLKPNDFKGGDGTECFKLLEKNGIRIVLKKESEDLLKNRLLYMNISECNLFFNFIDKIIKQYKLEYSDRRIVFSCANNTISFQIGHRIILAKRHKNQYMLISTKKNLGEAKCELFSSGNVLLYFKDNSKIKSIIDTTIKACSIELEKGDKHPKHDNPFFRKAVFNKKYRIELMKNTFNMKNDNITKPDYSKIIKDFRKEWPSDRLKKLKLKDYTNTKGTTTSSFTWDLEKGLLKPIASIENGPKTKFGIYQSSEKSRHRSEFTKNNKDGWYKDFGWNLNFSPNPDSTNKNAIFKNVLKSVNDIISYAETGELHKINDVKLYKNVKWKIALAYAKIGTVLSIPKASVLENALKSMGIQYKKGDIASYHQKLIDKKPKNIDFFDYCEDIYIRYKDGVNSELIDSKIKSKSVLNKILFGPPGTGKTFHTINKALQIVDPDFYHINIDDREKLKQRFDELLITDFDSMDGKIAFTTFHQSMSYEDFVEGIKPGVVNKNISYDVSRGIFRKICEIAEYKENVDSKESQVILNWSNKQFKDANFYKMSLGDTQEYEEADIYNYCIQNNCISIGFGNSINFTGLKKEGIYQEVKNNNLESFATDAINRFMNKLTIGDYVLISNGNLYARALCRVTSEYYFNNNDEIDHDHFRDVEWIFFDKHIHVTDIMEKQFTQMSIYHINKKFLKEIFFTTHTELLTEKEKSVVLIIDEINRGNVSSIFGELITLIEEDKRKGNDEELSVILPYSKESFSIPNNLHIIGTMNTADRSVEALDTALRRRFEFEEMLPNPGLLEDIECEGGIELNKMLSSLNRRIEKLIDKDNQIGHSYFMNSEKKLSLEQLQNIFKNKVIPLLQEYFYGDFAKIGLVLGNSFIKKMDDKVVFTDFDYEDKELLDERIVYKFSNIEDLGVKDFQSIYMKKPNE